MRWSFDFVLVTESRRFELFAASEDERVLWLHDLKNIVNSIKKNKAFNKEIGTDVLFNKLNYR